MLATCVLNLCLDLNNQLAIYYIRTYNYTIVPFIFYPVRQIYKKEV